MKKKYGLGRIALNLSCCVMLMLVAGCSGTHWRHSDKGVEGQMRITSAVVAADIYVDDQKVGTTPMDLPVSCVSASRLKLTAVAVDHPELRQTLILELPPIPETITVLDFGPWAGEAPAALPGDVSPKAVTAAAPQVIEKTVVQEKLILPPVVFFDTDRYIVKDRYRKALENFAIAMRKNDLALDIIGYADERHTVPYNQILSLNRARSVFSVLKSFGLDPERMRVEGRGELRTVDDRGKRLAWQHDRRVEIQLRRHEKSANPARGEER